MKLLKILSIAAIFYSLIGQVKGAERPTLHHTRAIEITSRILNKMHADTMSVRLLGSLGFGLVGGAVATVYTGDPAHAAIGLGLGIFISRFGLTRDPGVRNIAVTSINGNEIGISFSARHTEFQVGDIHTLNAESKYQFTITAADHRYDAIANTQYKAILTLMDSQ